MLRDWNYLFTENAVIEGQAMLSDTGAIEASLGLPHWLWAGLILLVSGTMVGGALKYALALSLGNARTVIQDLNPECVAVAAGANLDVLLGPAASVLQQVVNDLADSLGVDRQHRSLDIGVGDELDRVFEVLAGLANHRFDERHDVGFAAVHLGGGQFRNIEL